MSKTMLVGMGGSGRTTRLRQRYRQLALEHSTDNILVLLRNAKDVRDWREEVDLPWAGPLHVYTYFGWVQRELRHHWPYGSRWLEPEFLTVETGQFTMLEQVRRLEEAFAGIVTSQERLAIQLGSCLVLAAINGVKRKDIGPRLASAAGAGAEFDVAQKALDGYVRRLEKHGAMDYALAVYAYRKLLKNREYKKQLASRFNHLLVDDADELPPAAHELIELVAKGADSSVLVFSTDGGHSTFFGADPRGGWQRLSDGGQLELVPAGVGAGAGAALYGAILGGNPRPVKQGPELEFLEQDLRSQMLDAVADRVAGLVSEGMEANEIAVVSPLADRVLEHVLEHRLQQLDVPLYNLTKNKRLIDQPFVRVLMTLTLLAHPHWQPEWGLPDLAQSLQLLLKIDHVRAWLLSRQVKDFRLLPLEPWLRERVGFKAAADFDLLRQWLDNYSEQEELPVDAFFQRVFGELLSQLPPSRDDLVVCRQLMVSAQKFIRTAGRFPDLADETGPAFLRMLASGTVAADSLLEPESRERAVMLATPYSYISGHHHSKVQVWTDCTSMRWFQQDSRELLNPHVLSPHWTGGQWTDEHNLAASTLNGARTARALIRRCRGRLIAAAANVDSHGYEQNGPLQGLLYDVLAGSERYEV